jgi:hypothetical protein
MQRRQIQRRGAFAIGQLDVRAGRDQHVRHFQIVAIYGPLDGRGAVGLHRIDVGLLLHQRLHRRSSPFMAASATGLLLAAKALERTKSAPAQTG